MNKKNYRKLLYKSSGYFFLLPYLILFLSFLLFPIVYGFILSFFKWEMLTNTTPAFIGLANYKEALTTPYFWKALYATFRFVVMIVPVIVAAALLVAYGISIVPEKYQSIFKSTYFFPTIISISVTGILWRWFFNTEFGLFNSYLSHLGIRIPWLTDNSWAMKSIVFMTFWWTLGGPMIILLAGLKQIPEQYYEAADIDGANKIQRFFFITIPLLRPVLLFVIVMQVIGSFQVFGQTFLITRGGPENSTRVLMQYIYETAFTYYRLGFGAAMSWLLFFIIAIFSFLQFSFLKEK